MLLHSMPESPGVEVDGESGPSAERAEEDVIAPALAVG